MSVIVEWDDVRTGVKHALGEESLGWIDQIEIGLQQLKRNVGAGHYLPGESQLPVIVQIKQKFGDLRIYTDGTESASVQSAIKDICQQVSSTCERCGNAAAAQQIAGYVTRLCCHCYNQLLDERFEVSRVRWPADMDDLDVAKRFPSLVLPTCTRLKPVCGKGWQVPIFRGLQQMERALRKADMPPNTVQINDIKEKLGCLSIRYHLCDPVVEDIDKQVGFNTSQTCMYCGHYGGRHRGRRKLSCLCDHCLMSARAE